MKGMKGKVIPMNKLAFPLLAQRKFDGVRLLTTIRDHKVEFKTFNGNVVPLPKLAARIEHLPNVFLDGEIVYGDGKRIHRHKASGMINSAMHGGRISERLLNFNLFDTMPVAAWDRKRYTSDYSVRYEDTCVMGEMASLSVAENTLVRNAREVQIMVEALWEEDYEGLVLKPRYHKYTFTKHKDWAKIKQIKTADLHCYDVTEGTGWAEGGIGALMLEGMVEGKHVKVKSGSGLTKQLRFASINDFIGKTIEIKYESVTQDSVTLQHSLALPRFICVRIDK